MEYLPIRDLDDYRETPQSLGTTIAMLRVFADDIDAYIGANPDIDTRKLLEVIGECCVEAGLGMGVA